MEEAIVKYGFLFGIAFVWCVIAAVQDIRKTEVPNWISFSLLGIALGYRAIYSIVERDYHFIMYGFIGVVIFYFVAYAFYYSKAFGGGDVKLLIAFGAIIPIESFVGIALEGIGFIVSLLIIGIIYTFIYSIFLAMRHKERFKIEFKENFRYGKYVIILAVVLALILVFYSGFDFSVGMAALVVVGLSALYVYLRSIDKCMITKVNANKLMEGDWLQENVKLRKGEVKKSVHGLSKLEIERLIKEKKEVWIKGGVPFVPVFVVEVIFMIVFYFVFGLSFESLLMMFV